MRPTFATLSRKMLLSVATGVGTLFLPLIAAAQVATLTGRTVENVFTQFDPSSNALPNGNPNIPDNTPPLKFKLVRPSLLVVTFTVRVATENPAGTPPPNVAFTAFLDGQPLLLCPGCNPTRYESSTFPGAFDTKTITWVAPAPAGHHVFDVGWNLQGAGVGTVSVKTVVITASRS